MRRGRTHPTFIELQTNRPMYVHRRGSNIVNGEYYVDYDPERPIGHYGQARKSTSPRCASATKQALKADVKELAKKSPLAPGAGIVELPRFFAERYAPPSGRTASTHRCARSLAALNQPAIWPAPLPQTSHPYSRTPDRQECAGRFRAPRMWETTPTLRRTRIPRRRTSISTQEYLRNMNILIRSLAKTGTRQTSEAATSGEQR